MAWGERREPTALARAATATAPPSATSAQALAQPAPSKPALQVAQAFMARVAQIDIHRCPQCKTGQMRVVPVLAGLRRRPLPGAKPGLTSSPPVQAKGPPGAQAPAEVELESAVPAVRRGARLSLLRLLRLQSGYLPQNTHSKVAAARLKLKPGALREYHERQNFVAAHDRRHVCHHCEPLHMAHMPRSPRGW